MIVLLGASALMLAALQAIVAAPTSAFRGCLHDATTKATSEKVSADTIEDYLRKACTVQMGTLRDALVAFRMKNGMSKKAAADDAGDDHRRLCRDAVGQLQIHGAAECASKASGASAARRRSQPQKQ